MNLNDLTPEQKASLMLQLKEEQKQKEAQREKEIATYKQMVNDAVLEYFGILDAASAALAATKKKVFDGFEMLIESKKELYKVKEDQKSHTFTSMDGKKSITLGHRTVDGWGDTVGSGVAKIKEVIESLAKDEESAIFIKTIMNLLKEDKDGKLKASRVLELSSLATKINNPKFTEGLKIINAAYIPKRTCQFIEVKYRDENEKEHSLPLSISST